MLEFRTNKYVRASGTIENKGNNETALEGYDITLRANLPYFYSSDVYFTRSEWNDGAGYTMRTEELGVSAEIVPNMTITLAHQSQKGQTKESVASVAYSVPLQPKRANGTRTSNLFATNSTNLSNVKTASPKKSKKRLSRWVLNYEKIRLRHLRQQRGNAPSQMVLAVTVPQPKARFVYGKTDLP